MPDPVLLLGAAASPVAALTLGLRFVLVELRWWLALRAATPSERPAIIRAMRAPRVHMARTRGGPDDPMS